MAQSSVIGLLRVLLTANTAEFESAMKQSSASAKAWSKDLKQIGQQASDVGATLTKAFTVPIAGIGLAVTKMAIDFESNFANVAKTVDGVSDKAGKLTVTGQALAKTFREMSKAIPATTQELTAIAALGGQMGVPIEQLAHFTKNVAALGVAVDGISTEEAASSLASIGNATGTGTTKIAEMASALVHLGNNSNATEAQILEFTKRLIGAGHSAGMTVPEVMAIGTAMANVGVNAEAGGTAMSTVIGKISKAVSQGGAAVEEFAKVAGKSAEEFSAVWKRSSAEGIDLFIKGLSSMRERGVDLNLTMGELGTEGIRVASTLKLLSGAGDSVAKSIALANEGFSAGNKHLEEAEKKYATTANQLKLLWNKLVDVGVTIGEAFLPMIKSTIGMMSTLMPILETVATGFAALPGPIQMLAVGMAAAVAAVGPLLYIFGQLAISASALTAAFTTKGIATRALTAAMGGLATGATATAGSVGLLSAAFALLTNPVTLTIAGLGLVSLAVYKLMTAETDLEKAVRTNAEAFKRQSDTLDASLTVYRRLSGAQKLTGEQTSALDAATRALAAASGLSVEAFNREQQASSHLTTELAKQLVERKRLYEETVRQARANALEATADVARAREALRKLQSGETQKVDVVGVPGKVDAQTRAFTGAERVKEVERLTTVINELSKKAGEAQAAYSKLAGSVGNETQTFQEWGGVATRATEDVTGATKTYTAQLLDAQKALDAFAKKDPAKFKDLTAAIQSGKFELDELRKSSGLSELAFKVLTDRIKDTGKELAKTSGWIDDFRDGAKKLETQLKMAAKAGVPMTVVLEEFGAQIEKVANRAPILGDAIGKATAAAAQALKDANLAKVIDDVMEDANASARKLVLEMEKDGKEAGEKFWKALNASNKDFLAEAGTIQRGYVELGRESLEKRLALINLEYDAQVSSLDSTSTFYQQHLDLLEAKRRKALADATKDWEDHAFSIRDGMASALQSIGSAIQGLTGMVVAGIGRMIDSIKALTREGVSAGQRIAAAGMGVADVISGTGQGTTQQRTVSGVMSGASAGMAIGSFAGPYGMVAGAVIGAVVGGIIGLLRGRAANRILKDIGRDWATQISEELSKKIAEDARRLGSREAATLVNAPEIFQAAGGVEAFGVDNAIKKTRDLFVMIGTGTLTVHEAGAAFNEAFGMIAPEAIDKTTGIASAAFLELIALDKQYGTHSQAVSDFVTGQVGSAVTGIQSFLEVGANAYTRLAELEAEFATASGSAQAGLADQIRTQQQIIESSAISTQSAATAFGAALAGSFGELTARGMSAMQAIQALAPGIAALQTQLDATGLSGGAAFDQLRAMAALASDEIAGPAFTAVSGIGQALVGLQNSGLLTQEIFSGLSGQITETFNDLVAQGKDGDQALRLMQPTLQQLWQLQQDFGYEVDESTQLLLDQAEASGIVGDKFRSAQDRMVLALERIADAFDELLGKPAKLGKELDKLPKKINIKVGFETEDPPDFGRIKEGSGNTPPEDRVMFPTDAPPLEYARGSGGFRDFGRGRLAVLHGVEAVVTPPLVGRSGASDTMAPVNVYLTVDQSGAYIDSERTADRMTQAMFNKIRNGGTTLSEFQSLVTMARRGRG